MCVDWNSPARSCQLRKGNLGRERWLSGEEFVRLLQRIPNTLTGRFTTTCKFKPWGIRLLCELLH